MGGLTRARQGCPRAPVPLAADSGLRGDSAPLRVEALDRLPQSGVELAIATGTEDPWLLLAARSYVEGRSPDVMYQGKPWHLLGDAAGTTHGSPYSYDRRIPLIFFGPGFEQEKRFDRAA